MFAGGAAAGRHINSNNVRNMQLFHELKQQFPTVPDQVVSSCIAAHNANPTTTSLSDVLLLHQQQQQQQQQQQSREQSEEPLPPAATPNNNSASHMGGRNTIAAVVPCPAPLLLSCTPDNDDNDNVIKDKKALRDGDLVTDEQRTCDQRTPAAIETHTLNDASTCNEMHTHKSMELAKTTQLRDIDGGEAETKPSILRRFIKRPNNLAVKSIHYAGATSKRAGNKIQPSERYNDLHTLLNSTDTTAAYRKPPRSPSASRKPSPPTIAPKPNRPQTVASQTTDTLLSPTSNMNLSLNVVVSPGNEIISPPTPTPPCRHTTNLHVIPEPAWIQPCTPLGRSYTSVNLTLRPPTTEPQPPIDITSQNATLTYSTSSFDRTRGLQSRLEISVGPGGQSTVSSVRRQRPKSSYHPVLNGLCEDGVVGDNGAVVMGDGLAGVNMMTAGSLPNLATDEKATTVILEQQVRINRLRIELRTEKTRLVAMQREVADLEAIAAAAIRISETTATPLDTATTTAKTEDVAVERQLQREIRHLRGQCEQLAHAVDQRSESGVPLGETSREFYQNIYTGQQGSISVTSSATADYTARRIATITTQAQLVGNHCASNIPPTSTSIATTPGRPSPPPHTFHRPNTSPVHAPDETEDQSCWNCSVCTFQNHPLLNKCEQCEMLRGNTHTTQPHPHTPNRAHSNHHSLTPPHTWLSPNNPNSCSPGGSTGRAYPVQQYQALPPAYMSSVYGSPAAALPWLFPANSVPVYSPYYVSNSDSYGRRSSEGNGSAVTATVAPSGSHSRSLSQPANANVTGRGSRNARR